MSKKKTLPSIPNEGLVLDGSVAVAWCFPDEKDEYSQAVLDSMATSSAIVPDLWHLEVANALIVGERRKRSTQAETVAWMSFLSELPITVDEETRSHAFTDTMHLARSQQLSAYDAAYLELALRRSLPLATLDQRLRTAAKSLGIAVYSVQ